MCVCVQSWRGVGVTVFYNKVLVSEPFCWVTNTSGPKLGYRTIWLQNIAAWTHLGRLNVSLPKQRCLEKPQLFCFVSRRSFCWGVLLGSLDWCCKKNKKQKTPLVLHFPHSHKPACALWMSVFRSSIFNPNSKELPSTKKQMSVGSSRGGCIQRQTDCVTGSQF